MSHPLLGSVFGRLTAQLLALIVAVGLLGPPNAVRAQQQTIKDTIYTSPSWGYSIRWYYDEWMLDLDLSFEGSDILGLRDDRLNYVTFTGEVGFNGDADACLDQMIAETGAGDITLAKDTFGDPFEYRDPEQSYIVYQSRFPDADGTPQDLVVYAECQTLIPGEAVFKRQYSGPPEVFEQDYDRIVDMIESVHLPRASAWLPYDETDNRFVWAGEAPLLGVPRESPNLFPFPEEGTVLTLLIDQVDQAGTTRVVTFENITGAPVTVEPANLALELVSLFDETPPVIEPASTIVWEDGDNANLDGSRTLVPGERATVHVSIAPINTSAMSCDVIPYLSITYRDSAGNSTDFAPASLSHCGEEATSPRPVFPAPLPAGVSREPLIPATDGQLDTLGRIPLARITLAPGASTPDSLLAAPYTAVVESGSLDMTFGESDFTVSAGAQLSAESGPALVARNSTDAPATMLVISLEARDDWGIPLEESPPPGLTFDLLFPEQNVTERQAPRAFSIEHLTLEPGAMFESGSEAESIPGMTALWVTEGDVIVTPADRVSDSTPVSANSGVFLPPSAMVQAVSNQPAEALLIHVTEASPPG